MEYNTYKENSRLRQGKVFIDAVVTAIYPEDARKGTIFSFTVKVNKTVCIMFTWEVQHLPRIRGRGMFVLNVSVR